VPVAIEEPHPVSWHLSICARQDSRGGIAAGTGGPYAAGVVAPPDAHDRNFRPQLIRLSAITLSEEPRMYIRYPILLISWNRRHAVAG